MKQTYLPTPSLDLWLLPLISLILLTFNPNPTSIHTLTPTHMPAPTPTSSSCPTLAPSSSTLITHTPTPTFSLTPSHMPTPTPYYYTHSCLPIPLLRLNPSFTFPVPLSHPLIVLFFFYPVPNSSSFATLSWLIFLLTTSASPTLLQLHLLLLLLSYHLPYSFLLYSFSQYFSSQHSRSTQPPVPHFRWLTLLLSSVNI